MTLWYISHIIIDEIWNISHNERLKKLNKFEVLFFEKDDDSCPVEEFLSSLDKKMRAKLLKEIALLQDVGNELREPYSKHLDDGIFELRAKQGNNISRVLYFFIINQQIILTNGFIKKTQKTPANELALAKKYREIYLNRREDI